jgi:hypothetical protein
MNDDELSWLWEASSALYPGYYVLAPPGHYPRVNVTYDSSRRGLDSNVAEAVRVAQSAPSGKRPQIFLYGRASYYSVEGFAQKAWAQNESGLLQQTDLESMVARPAAHGISGVVLWGASQDCQSTKGGRSITQKCDDQSEFIRSSLGPAAMKAIAAAGECAKKTCPQGGRCVTIDPTGKDLDKPTCSAKSDDDDQTPDARSLVTLARSVRNSVQTTAETCLEAISDDGSLVAGVATVPSGSTHCARSAADDSFVCGGLGNQVDIMRFIGTCLRSRFIAVVNLGMTGID